MIEQFPSLNTNINHCCPRKQERASTFAYRTKRFFSVGHEWFFSTREGIDQGPFLSRGVAELAVEIYIDNLDKHIKNYLKSIK